ncbi:hypothetical protein J5X84_33095 [Streptosporangiaceae bacterium NEAU-GS5]|nr:hypothetical protein [Streptosporangiaceae bacterium NEAU-GS5]
MTTVSMARSEMEGLIMADEVIEEIRRSLTDPATGELVQVAARFDAVDARFDAVDARLDRMDARFDGIDARLDRMDARLEGMDAWLDRLDGRVDRLSGRFSEFDTRLSAIEESLRDPETGELVQVAASLKSLEAQQTKILAILELMRP